MRKFILMWLIITVCINAVFSQVLHVAIIDFENTSGISKYDGLGKAMSSMLISDIEANVSPKRLQLVERSQINKILKEQSFQSSSAVDKASAVQIGKILGVKYILVGDIYVLNDILVINARLTDTETGEIKFSKKQEGNITQWLTLKTNIAHDLASSISIPFSEPNIPDKEINSAVITTYGNALTAKDEGNIDKAEQLINTVQDFNPEFKYAEEIKIQLEELKKQVKQNTADVKSLKKSVSTLEFSIKRIEESNSDPIGNPSTAYDYLTNALLFKKSGDNIKAASNFKKYFDFNLSFFEPHLEFQELLSNMNSNSENESYLDYLKKHQDTFHNFIYIIFSYTGESLLNEIEQFNAANSSFQLSELFRDKLIIKLDQSSSSLNPNSMDFCQITEKYKKSSQNLDKIKAAVTYDQYFIDKALAKDYITQNEINYINSWSTFLFNLIEGLTNQGVTSEDQIIDFVKKMGGCTYCPDSTIVKTLKLVNMKKQKIAGNQVKKFNKIEGKFNLLSNGTVNNENYILIENAKYMTKIYNIG
jgi:TolB-like protein